jgi:hypothetical protein
MRSRVNAFIVKAAVELNAYVLREVPRECHVARQGLALSNETCSESKG